MTNEVRDISWRYKLSPKALKRRRIIQLVEDCIFAAIFFGIYVLTAFLLMICGVL